MTALQNDFQAAAPASETAPPPIAILMSRFPSVTETFILREMIEMEKQGQPVRVVPMVKETPPVLHEAVKPWVNRALYTPWISAKIIAACARAIVRQPRKMVSLAVRLIAGTITKPGTLIRTLALFPKSVYLAEQLSAEGIRHMHAHYATYPSTMALIIAALTDITFSFTVHAHDIQVDRALLDWKLRETRFVRSISDYNKRFLEKLYPQEAAGKIHVVHVGIEPDIYAKASERAPSADVPSVLCVAAHKPYKGIPYLIEASRILREEGVAFHCDVVGQGPMTAELEKMIADKNVGDVIRLAGPRPQEEVTRLMGEATLFVLPSIVAADGQMEGIPVALMEALASGRPVVSTKISGIPELVEDGVNGLLVEPEDAVALAQAMREILDNAVRARSMGLNGRAKVRDAFDLARCTSELVTLLENENAVRKAA